MAEDSDEELAGVWTSSFVSDQGDRFADDLTWTLGVRLTELVSDLKTRRAPQRRIDALNQAF